jgi:4'-phosphopantetheinyl transferase
MFDFLNKNSKDYGFYFGLQKTAEVRKQLKFHKENFVEKTINAHEKRIFNALKIEKRRVEWLSGRMAAKEAFKQFNNKSYENTYRKEITILNQQNRAPYILEIPELYISISHSSEFAVAVISQNKIGVDIETIEQRPTALMDYFCSKNEQTILQNLRNNSSRSYILLTKFWTRKEAISKYVQLGAKLNFKKIDTVADIFYNDIISENEIRLLSEQFNNYCMTIAI